MELFVIVGAGDEAPCDPANKPIYFIMAITSLRLPVVMAVDKGRKDSF